MKSNQPKRLLSLLLCLCMVTGLLPVTAGAANVSNAGPNPSATSADHNTHIIVAETATNNAKFCPYTTYSGYTISAPEGMSYDRSTNTLTLNNYDGAGYYIQTNMMGSDFKVQLIGTNVLDGMDIWGAGWGCGLTFTGSGTLTVNGSMTRSYGLQLNGEGAEPILHVSQESTVTVYGDGVGHAIFLEGSTSLSASPITYGGTLSGGTPVAKRPNLRTGDVNTGNGVISCLVCTKNGDSSGVFYGFSTAYSSIPVSITYRLWKLTGDPASGFTLAEKVMDESSGQQVSYVSTDGQDPPPGVLENYTMVQEDLANWSISSDGDFLHPATVVIFSPGGAEVPDVLSITTTSLPEGKTGETYTSTTLTATGYDPAKSLTWTAEGLPEGLTLSPGGTLSGTPAESGSFIVKVTAQVNGSGATGTTARRSYVLSIASNPFLFTLDNNIDSDVYGKQCYLKGKTVNGTNLTLWSGELKQGTTSLPVSDQCLGATMAEVNLTYYYSGGAEDLATYTGSSITLSEGGRAALTGKGDVLVALPEIKFKENYPGVTGSFGFQITGGGFSYSAGSLAPKGTNNSWLLTAYLNYNPSEASTLYNLDSLTFSGPGVKPDSNGRYTYTPSENSGNSPITITLTEWKLSEYTVTLASSADDITLPDLSGARLTVSQSGMYGTNTATATVTYDESTQTNSAKMQLYSGNASVSLIQAGKYALANSTVNIPAGSSSVTVNVVPSEVKDMSLAISAVPEADALAEYARLLGQQNSAVTIRAGDETAEIGSYNILTESANTKTIYSSSSAALYDTLYKNGGTCTIAWEESGPVYSGQQSLTWGKGSLTEHAILEVSLKGGVLVEVTNQSSTVYFSPWWYNPADESWHMGSSVRAGVGQTEKLALWCPGSTGTEADWNLLLVPQWVANPTGLTWGEAKTAYSGMPVIEAVSIQDNAVVTTEAPLTVNKDAVDRIANPLKPYSTFVGPDQFDSTDDLLVYTGHIQANELYEGRTGGMTRLWLDAAGTDSGGRVATQISSVVVNGVEYPYTKIQLETEPLQKDQLVSIQFQTYYQITFSEPVELPCDITVYAKPMAEASDAVLQLSVNLEKHSALQLVNTAVVKAPDLSVSVPSVTGGDTVTAYVTAPSNYPTVRIYDGDELVATSRNGSVQIPLCGTSKSMTTSHRLTFRSFNAKGEEGPSVTRTVLHADGLPTVTAQHLLSGNREVSRNTVYSFTSANPAPFQMICSMENADKIKGGVSFAVRFLDGTVRYIEATQDGNLFSTAKFTSSSPVIGAQVLYEIDWDKVQAAMNANLNVPGNTLGGSNSFESTIVLPWSDYKNELTQYQEAFQYLEDNEGEAQKYQDALKTNGDQMKNAGTLNFGRASSQTPVDVDSGAKTAQEMFDHLDNAAITDLKQGQTLYTGFTRQVTKNFFQAELGNGSGFSRLILADGNDIKYEMYVKLIELGNKEGTGTLVLAADYVTGGDGNPLYMEIGSVAVQGTAATAAASNGQSASAPLSKSGGARNGDTSTPSSGGYYFTDIDDDQTMSAMDYASCVSDGYVTGVSTGLDVINTAGYYIDGTVDSVGESGFAAGGYTTALSVAGVGKATYDTAVNYSTLGDLYTMSANLLNSPCAQKLAKVNPGFISNMQNQLTEYKAMLDDAGAWNIGMGAYNVVNGAVGAAGGYAIPWVTLATAGLGMFGDAIVKQKVSNCEATGTVLYDTMQLFIKKYANQYDDPECKGGSSSNPNDKDKDKEKDIQDKNPEEPYRACIDPSGVVYEAVLSNPVEGATVTLYTDSINYAPTYQTTKDDKTGATYQIMVDQDGNPARPTNAGEASGARLTTPVGSTIPAETVLTTGADGRYQWMVEEGLWYVTAHKEGYQDGNSGNDVAAVVSSGSGTDTINWLPVSPEQLNVNIPLVSHEAPTVTAEYRDDGVYLTFSKYMDNETLTANGAFKINGSNATVELLNSEQAPANIDYNGAEAGYGTAPSYTSQIKLAVAEGTTLSGNVTVTIGSGVKSYAGVPCTTKTEGLTLNGEVGEATSVTTPTITSSDGNTQGEVPYGSTVTITCATDGTILYYTTDGSEPTTASARYYPGQTIAIDRDMTIKVLAVKPGYTDATASASFTVPTDKNVTIGDDYEQPGTDPGTNPGVGGGGGGGGGGAATYAVSLPEGITGGAVTVSPEKAAKGDTVTITVKPDDGYELDKLTVTDAKGNEVKLTDKGGGTYTFTMPASKVEIQVSFQERAGQGDNPFTDVSESAYYYDAVLWAVENGVTNGTSPTTFRPNAPVTRAQMVTFLWRAYGAPEATGQNPFTDVDGDTWYYDAVLWAVANGVTNGTTATTFAPEAPVTRAQAVTFQWRAAGSPEATGESFDDVAADAYYADAVTWAVEQGITNGTSPTTFRPEAPVTRAQAVTFLYRELA